MDQILKSLNFTFSFAQSRGVCNYDLIGSQIKKEEEVLVIYLNSIVNHKIWKFNMGIQYDECIFTQKKFFSSLVKTIDGRKRMEQSDRMKQCQKIVGIDKLSDAVNHACTTLHGVR